MLRRRWSGKISYFIDWYWCMLSNGSLILQVIWSKLTTFYIDMFTWCLPNKQFSEWHKSTNNPIPSRFGNYRPPTGDIYQFVNEREVHLLVTKNRDKHVLTENKNKIHRDSPRWVLEKYNKLLKWHTAKGFHFHFHFRTIFKHSLTRF